MAGRGLGRSGQGRGGVGRGAGDGRGGAHGDGGVSQWAGTGAETANDPVRRRRKLRRTWGPRGGAALQRHGGDRPHGGVRDGRGHQGRRRRVDLQGKAKLSTLGFHLSHFRDLPRSFEPFVGVELGGGVGLRGVGAVGSGAESGDGTGLLRDKKEKQEEE